MRGDSKESCTNCGSAVIRRYCADCGQAVPRATDYSLRAFAADSIDQIASVDGRAVRTVKTLLARPGLLTADHMRGRRARYLRPLQLFLLVNVLLFVVAPKVPMFTYSLDRYLANSPPSPSLVAALVQRATTMGTVDRAAYTTAFDGRVESQRKTLILIFVPAIALVLRVLFAWRRTRDGVPHRYGEHLVFALHLLSLIWLVLTVWGGIATLAAGTTLGPLAGIGALAIIIGMLLAGFVYLMRSVRLVYELSDLQSVAVSAALAVAFAGLLLAYRGLLFFTTYYTL